MPRRSAAWLWLALCLSCGGGETGPPADAVRVRVDSVALDEYSLPVVILEELSGRRMLPIWIGTAEATSIAATLNAELAIRPNTHDMMGRVIDGLEAEVVRVVVTELRSGTYYALLTLRSAAKTVEIDIRPSDGIAVALRAGAPIWVRAPLFEQVEVELDDEEGRPI